MDGIGPRTGPLAVKDSECQQGASRLKTTKGDRVPTYQYVCNDCGESLEAVQKFSDDALTVCPSCEGRLRKVYSAVGVVFKGSGFYRNDSRSTGSSATPATPAKTDAAAASTTSSSSSDSSSSGSGSAPAARAPAARTPAAQATPHRPQRQRAEEVGRLQGRLSFPQVRHSSTAAGWTCPAAGRGPTVGSCPQPLPARRLGTSRCAGTAGVGGSAGTDAASRPGSPGCRSSARWRQRRRPVR